MTMIYVTKADLPDFEEYAKYLKRIWANRCLTNNGEFVQSLEDKLKTYLKTDDIILVSNGTLAIHLALRALHLKGEIITTAFTFAATTNVLVWEGLTPIFADIEPDTFNLDPKDVEKKITNKTSAILAVHVYGNPCYVEELQATAERHNIKLIYDSAHAFGVKYKGHSVLNFGDISTLSFHATKVFNTIEGGAIIAKDPKLYDELKLLRNHGIASDTQVVFPGTNAKMNEFQAAMGLCNLKNLDQNISLRRELYERYKQKLSGIDFLQFQRIIASKYNFSYMPVLFESQQRRDTIYSVLLKNGVKARKYFFPLTTDFDYFRGRNFVKKYDLKNSFFVSNQVLCLPLYPDLKVSEVDNIVSLILQEYP